MRPFDFKKNCLFILFTALILSSPVLGFKQMSRDYALNQASWELVVQTASKGKGLAFPVKIEDRSKLQKLNKSMPVIGTPIVVKLKEYYPDYQKQDSIVADPKGGSIAAVTMKGKNLNKTMMLISEDPARRSISSSIGGVAIRKFSPKENVEAFLKEVADKNAVGILTVELKDGPVDVIVGKKGSYKIPGSDYSIEVMEYMPHYSVDRKTKKVTNASKMPTNPAVKIRLNDGKKYHYKWLWSRFAVSPHALTELPVKVVFNDFDLAGSEGRYIIVQDKKDTWLNCIRSGKRIIEKAALGKPYPFKDKAYTFTINEIVEQAVIKTSWENKSQTLKNPAVLVEVTQDGVSRDALIEFGKAARVKTESGKMVTMYFRQGQKPAESK